MLCHRLRYITSTVTVFDGSHADGIVAACALAEGAETIITRDERASDGLGIEKHSPSEFLEARGFSPIDL